MIMDDTIVALSTPQGKGAIGVIRLSGVRAIEISQNLFPTLDLISAASHTLHFGIIMDGSEVIDEAVVGLFKSPKSYTSQDVVEISCHGSPFILQKVLQLLIKHGASPAKPGEFTMRAFLNGRFDLMQAEAVGDLIASETETAHHIAMNQMRGGFSGELKQLRQKLVDFASLIELELDFSEEDVEFANREQLISLMKEMMKRIETLIESFKLGNVLKNGVSTVIAGRPNAGKSTLLNALLNEERAIVSDIPGTTRDTIEEIINIQGIAFRLTDTAGIREATDLIEKKGVEKTFEKIEQASILVYLFDPNELSGKEVDEDLKKISKKVDVIPVANKIDSLKDGNKITIGTKNLVSISAKTGEGVDQLKKKIYELAVQGRNMQENLILTNARHYEALKSTLHNLTNALKGIETRKSGELVASDIRSALNHLGEITGEVTTDDLLGNIFGKFCIGK